MLRYAPLLAGLVCTAALSAAMAPAAGAEEAWWGLNAGSRPAYLKAGVGQSEVQELTSTTEEFAGHPEQAAFEVSVGETSVGAFITEPTAAEFGFTPLSAANLQSALETVYGAGNVTVSEEAASPGTLKFRIASVGADAGQPVPSIKVASLGIGGPKATVTTRGRPDGELYATFENLGDATLTGEKVPVKITDTLPPGLKAIGVHATNVDLADFINRIALPCSIEESGARVSCTLEGVVLPYNELEMRVAVLVQGQVSAENEVSASGGEGFRCRQVQVGTGLWNNIGCVNKQAGGSFEREAIGPVAPVTIRRPVTIGSAPVPFGVSDYELTHEEEGGAPATQAGAHPFQQTTNITLNQGADVGSLEQATGRVQAAKPAKDLQFHWPAGLIGNPHPIPQCTDQQFFAAHEFANLCPADTAIGVATVTINEPVLTGVIEIPVPLFNLKPHPGEPDRLGFNIVAGNAPVVIDTSVRTGSDYGVTVKVDNITQSAALLSSQVTVWGVPGDPRHDHQRGWACLDESAGVIEAPLSAGGLGPCQGSGEEHPAPFLSLPTSCEHPLQTGVAADSWTEPGIFREYPGAFQPEQALTGCNRLPFRPSIEVTPNGTAASTPTGLNVDVHVPQAESLNAAGLAISDPRDITVALPEGVAVNPANGDGLQACTGDPGALPAGRLGSPGDQIGFTGFNETIAPGSKTATFTPFMPGSIGAKGAVDATEFAESEGTLEPGANFCPNASKIGTVTVRTPVLPNPIEGAVYLATQNQNPFGSLIALYAVAEDPLSGVLIKLLGETHLTATGQIVTTFHDSPQAPFEDAEFHFFGGERAPLMTPARCGAYTTTAQFTSWSDDPGAPAHTASSTFNITTGPKTAAQPNGSPCPGSALPFSPSLTGGTTNVNAGFFSPLTTTIGRQDGEQNLRSVQLHMPAGLEGLLTGVKLCSEAQANAGTCGPESQIGETTVAAGVGGDPVTVRGGKVYLTEKYAGAPFGLSIVNPVKAGPFDLEHDTSNPNNRPPCDCVVVRARIEVDPRTAQLTIATDAEGPHAIPSLIDGIPVQIKKVNVTVDREHFTFNPTSCAPTSITGALGGYEGATGPLSVPFQVGNCALLAFQPSFEVSTSGETSRKNGASLRVKLTYPNAPFGTQTNIRSVHVELPKALPSRLTTLNHACLDSVFNQDPANCPSQSRVGFAKAVTPVLPVPLEGPAYFVSHGGERFPELTVILQGYGVTVHLEGETFISKAGITSSTFRSVPDVPVGSFELTLPEGPFSALAANTDLCAANLAMPTAFTGQNGATLKQSTQIEVEGCTYSLRIVHRNVRKRTLTLKVSVPVAGRIVASGKGVSSAATSTKSRQTLTLTLKEGHAGKLRTKILLRFTPSQGKQRKILRKSITVMFG